MRLVERKEMLQRKLDKLFTVLQPFLQYVYQLPNEEEQRGHYSDKALKLFAWQWPALYFKTIDHMHVIIAFYLSLWVVHFSYATLAFPEPKRSAWRVSDCTFLPPYKVQLLNRLV